MFYKLYINGYQHSRISKTLWKDMMITGDGWI